MPEQTTIKTATTLFDVVEALQRLDGATVTEIANDVDIAKSTAHRHLASLLSRGYVIKRDKQHHLGLKFLDHGAYVRQTTSVYRIVKPKVREIAEKVSELNQFVVEEHGKLVVVFREQGRDAVKTESRVGKRTYLHQNAGGKAILSALPKDRVETIIRTHGLPAKTSNTITDQEELFAELEEIRERGVAFDFEEHIMGFRAIGAPIMDQDGNLCGALAVGGPTNRMKGDRFHEEIPQTLLGVVNELELNIQYSDVY